MEQLIRITHVAGYYGPVKDGRTLVRDPFDPDAPAAALGRLLCHDDGFPSLAWPAYRGRAPCRLSLRLTLWFMNLIGALPSMAVNGVYRIRWISR
jgi:hypothetical protein